MGTPDLAAAVLDRVLAWDGGRVLAVYCQPDRPAGRGMSLKAPPVKELALLHSLPVHQPLTLKSAAEIAVLRSYAPDYILVAAYGLILPQSVLDIPVRMPLNVHTSLLPKYRGAAPIQRAIMAGETVTGVTIMRMEAGLDTGPIVLQRSVPIGVDDTAEDMREILAELGGNLLVEALGGLESGKMTSTPQNDAKASQAAKLRKSDGILDFSATAAEIHAVFRGVTPWPGATGTLERDGEAPLSVTIVKGKRSGTAAVPDKAASLPPGSVLPKLVENALAVACADGVYLITVLRPAGRKAMDSAAFMNGYLKERGNAHFALPTG